MTHELFPGQEVVGLSNLRGKALEEAKKGLKDGVLYVCTYEALEKIGFKPETEDELYEDVEFATDNPFKKESKRDKAQDNEDKDFTVGQMTMPQASSASRISRWITNQSDFFLPGNAAESRLKISITYLH